MGRVPAYLTDGDDIGGNMPDGLWVVFEGADGVGKTTVMRAVSAALRKRLPSVEIIDTRHPGSTSLGAHIRDIVKHPGNYSVTIDPLSTQMLMFTDHISFRETMLVPALARGAIVLADRCDLVSGLVYGVATGLQPDRHGSLGVLITIATPPRVNAMYILRCPVDVQSTRMTTRGQRDRFETDSIQAKVNALYEGLLTSRVYDMVLLNRIVPLDAIKYVDNIGAVEAVSNPIVDDIIRRYTQSLDEQ